jgi:hypothetical protein
MLTDKELAEAREHVVDDGRLTDTPSSIPWLVVIKREQESVEVTPFDNEEAARVFASTVGADWSDTFVCRVVKGPNDGAAMAVSDEEMVARVAKGIETEAATWETFFGHTVARHLALAAIAAMRGTP